MPAQRPRRRPCTTRPPGSAFMSEVSSRSRVPPTISGWAAIASRIARRAGARPCRGSSAGDRVRVGQERVGAGDRRQREGVRLARRSCRPPSRRRSGRRRRRPARRRRGRRPGPGGRRSSSPRGSSRRGGPGGASRRGSRSTCGGSARPARRRGPAGPRSAGRAGAPSLPQARSVCVSPERRKTACRVRTWRSSPECELAIRAISGGDEAEVAEPAGLGEGDEGERLDARAQRDLDLGVAGDVGDAPGLVDPHDVAAVDALHDLAADLAGEDRAAAWPRAAGGAGGRDGRRAGGRAGGMVGRG